MMMTRRQFLLSTAGATAGCILPSFYTRAIEFLDQFGEPLLETPKLIHDELFISAERDYELNLGDPWSEPPKMTWLECLERYYPDSLDDIEGEWGIKESDLEEITKKTMADIGFLFLARKVEYDEAYAIVKDLYANS